jgi:transposase-like protein
MKKGSRRGINRYQCKKGHSFSVNHKIKFPHLWVRHIDGTPIRKLANEMGISIAQTYARIVDEFNQLPDNNELTRHYCNRFSGILIVDGKYVKVRGYPKKIPFIYGIDYLTHDIVIALLAPSENVVALTQFFALLKRCGYPLQIVVADDREAIAQGLARIYPHARLQLCHNHYVENLRKQLCIRTDPTHRVFFHAVKNSIFDAPHDHISVRPVLKQLFLQFAQYDVVRQTILREIDTRRAALFAYATIPHCPKSSNLIELYNSHVNGRLKTIKGFKSFRAAARWLNAAVLRRRTTPLTDCRGTFKKLNGHCSIAFTIKKGIIFPKII